MYFLLGFVFAFSELVGEPALSVMFGIGGGGAFKFGNISVTGANDGAVGTSACSGFWIGDRDLDRFSLE